MKGFSLVSGRREGACKHQNTGFQNGEAMETSWIRMKDEELRTGGVVCSLASLQCIGDTKTEWDD